MNEIKHIHLGRQSFTISVEAYKELHEYLDAIKAQVGKKADVVDEVEMRMAELLEERGIHDDKVVLPEDIQFLKEQLGEPHDFKDEDDEVDAESEKQTSEAGQKRLFRDGDRAMFAGVAAGLAAFFGLDVTIVRLIFILLTLFGGSGVLIYIILWLIVPEARTSSERLQMRGKAVTVDSLKEVIDRANISGAAERVGKVGQQLGHGVGRRASGVVEGIAKFILEILGCVLMTTAVLLFSGTAVAGAYMLAHGGKMADEVVFPVGSEAVWGLFCAVAVLMVFAFFMLVAGLAMLRRKSVIKGWVLGILTGVFLIAGGAGTLIGFDIAPQIRDKYRALHHTQITSVNPFTKLNITGKDVNFEFVPDNTYSVEVQYFGTTSKIQDIKETIDGDTLTVDTSKYRNEGDSKCITFCFYSGDWLVVKVHAPTLVAADVRGSNVNLAFTEGFQSDNLSLTVAPNNWTALRNLSYTKVMAETGTSTAGRHVTFQGVTSKGEYNDTTIGQELNIDHTSELEVTGEKMCDDDEPSIYLHQSPSVLTINGTKVEPPTRQSLAHLWQQDSRNAYNCVTIL
jgi:phage shock protein PspC (stress-responsive transcriptional regulator)